MNDHNVRRGDISVNRNYAGDYVLSTVYCGYYRQRTFPGYTLKNARSEFIVHLRRL